MFKQLRRNDRAISLNEAIEILMNGEFGILSTFNGEFPYGVPVNYVIKDSSIYFHSAIEGHKLDNIRKFDKVSFCIVGKTKLLPEKFTTIYESVIVFGKAKIINGQEKYDALKLLIEKYSPEFIEKGIDYINKAIEKTNIVKIDILHISGKARKE